MEPNEEPAATQMSNIDPMAKKNREKDLGQHHSRVAPVFLRVNATAHAGGGRCPRRSHKILDAF